jgi:branched-chain amino acid transport system permease protein
VEELSLILVRGLGLGAIFALVGMSFNIVHRSSGILNFAQGNMLVLGGVFAFATAAPGMGLVHWLVLLIAAMLTLALVVALQGALTLWPLRSSVEQHSWLITTLAASVIIGAVILVLAGTSQLTVASPFGGIRIMGVRTPLPYLLTVGLALVWFVGLRWFYARTITGLAISAIAQDLDAARAAGIRVRRLQITAFAISGVIVGSAGFVAAPIIAIANDSGVAYVLNGFVAAVVGGIGNDIGALSGGALVGIAATYAAFEYGGEYQNAVSLALLIIVLMVRPQGLFGRPAARRF